MQRAVITRSENISTIPKHFKRATPAIVQSKLQFQYSKEAMSEKYTGKSVPCSTGTINLHDRLIRIFKSGIFKLQLFFLVIDTSFMKAIIWCDVPEKCLEAAIEGRKQGTTKKDIHKPNSRLAMLCSNKTCFQYSRFNRVSLINFLC